MFPPLQLQPIGSMVVLAQLDCCAYSEQNSRPIQNIYSYKIK